MRHPFAWLVISSRGSSFLASCVILSESEGSHAHRLPWMRPGWFAEVTAWIDAQLTRLGHNQTTPIEQVTAQPWSAVLRVPTTAGTLYFKVPAPIFAFELPLTETLAHLIPSSVPHLLATDKPRPHDTSGGYMLMQDAGKTLRSGPLDPAQTVGPDLSRPSPIYRLEEALQRFAQIQLQLAPHLVTLKATGCPDWRLSQLPQLYQQPPRYIGGLPSRNPLPHARRTKRPAPQRIRTTPGIHPTPLRPMRRARQLPHPRNTRPL